MKKLIYGILLIGFVLFLNSCSVQKQVINDPEEVIQLRMSNLDDGTNGSGVAYNSDIKLYYTVIAGNAEFPLEVFEENGENVYTASAGVDCRGLWYNKSTKTLEANVYQGGLYKIIISEEGIPTGQIAAVFDGGEQPYSNSCAEYNFKSGKLLYYYSGTVYTANRKNGKIESKIKLELPCNIEDINTTSIIYTGYKGMEIGILNCGQWKLYLFNLKDGSLKATVNIPDYMTVDCAFMFDFANDYAFFYNVNDRIWSGIKIFK